MLRRGEPLLKPVSLLNTRPGTAPLSPDLAAAIREVSLRDVQYTLQVEEVDRDGELYRLRMERNEQAARARWPGCRRTGRMSS